MDAPASTRASTGPLTISGPGANGSRDRQSDATHPARHRGAPGQPPALALQRPSLPALVALLAVLQLVFPYRAWIILLVGLGGAWLTGYLWARSLSKGLRLRREVRSAWTQVGDEMMERFRLANQSRLPAPWVELIDHSTLPGYPGRRVVGVGGSDVLQWHQQTVCTRRGLFTLGPTTLRTADPLGIYLVEAHQSAWDTLTVVPPVLPLPSIEVAPGGQLGGGRPRRTALERTVSSAGVREYLPGDSLRAIHWPTSARLDSTFVRLFDHSADGDWWILLDMDRHAHAGEGETSTQEHAVLLAASLAYQGIEGGRSVGLITLGSGMAGQEELIWLPPRRDQGQRWEILRALAVAGPGSMSLADLLAQARSSLDRSASLILITPASHGAWLESLLPFLQRGAVPTVLLLDPASFGGTADARATDHLLTELGVHHRLVPRSFIEGWKPRPRRPHHGRRPGLREDPWRLLG